MANKYIIHGATYNGDGTASNEAASAGAAGAWNHIDILTGTAVGYGSIAAGDTIFIRSKDHSGANLQIAWSAADATFGSGVATLTSPVTWILDQGTVWAGITGTMTWLSQSYKKCFIAFHNRFFCSDRTKFIYKLDTTSTQDGWFCLNAAHVEGITIDATNSTGNYGFGIYFGGIPGSVTALSTLANATVTTYKSGGSGPAVFAIGGGGINGECAAQIINCDVTITAAGNTGPVLSVWDQYQASIRVIGGSWGGAGITSSNPVVWAGAGVIGTFQIIGTQIPSGVPILSETSVPFTGSTAQGGLYCIGVDAQAGGYLCEGWGFLDSRRYNNPPTLNATLPDSAATAWAYRMYPAGVVSGYPGRLALMKYFSDASATKTVTLNLLVSNVAGTPNTGYDADLNKDNCYALVQYTDSGGTVRYETTRVLGSTSNLDSSTAAWSATTWGTANFTKRQLSLTTAYAVKQNTMVIVTLLVAKQANASSKYLFVCPDVQFS